MALAGAMVLTFAMPYAAQAAFIADNKVTISSVGFVLSGTYSGLGGQPSGTGEFKNGNVKDYPEGSCIPNHFAVTNTDSAAGDILVSPVYDYASSNGVVGVSNLEKITGGSPSATNLNAFTYTGQPLTSYTSFDGVSATVTGPFAGDDDSTTAVSSTDQFRHYNIILSDVDAGEMVDMLFCARLGLDASEYNNGSALSIRTAQDGAENIPIPVNQILQLPSITVNKTVNGGTATASDFTFTISPAVNGASTYTIPSGQTSVVINNVDPDTSYTITESSLSGYQFASGSGTGCTFTGSTANVNATAIDAGKPPINAICTFVNEFTPPTTGTITVQKVVTNDNGGTAQISDFSFTVGATTVSEGVAATFGAATYQVGETGPSGYTATFSGDCDLQGSITLAAPQNLTCTITNNDIQPTLTVVKVVNNSNGGTLNVSDFPLFVDTTAVTSGQANGFNAGTYTVSETNQTNYTASFSGDCNSSGSVTLAAGENKTCTITNTFNAPPPPNPGTLIIIKHVINDNSGTKAAADFTINVTGTNVSNSSFAGAESPGTTVTLAPGSYSVDEIADSGYVKTLGTECSGTIASDQTITCTITNDDVAPDIADLQIVKDISDASLAVGQTFDFTLTVTNLGPDLATGVSVADTFPDSQLDFVSATVPAGTSFDDTTKVWTIGDLAKDASVVLTITATVKSGMQGETITNSATVTSTTQDSNTSNNTDDATGSVPRRSGGGGGGGGHSSGGSNSPGLQFQPVPQVLGESTPPPAILAAETLPRTGAPFALLAFPAIFGAPLLFRRKR